MTNFNKHFFLISYSLIFPIYPPPWLKQILASLLSADVDPKNPSLFLWNAEHQGLSLFFFGVHCLCHFMYVKYTLMRIVHIGFSVYNVHCTVNIFKKPLFAFFMLYS